MSTQSHAKAIEDLTWKLGHAMFDRMETSRPTPLEATWWQEQALELCMQDEWLKVQAFRFVDVLPTLGYQPREIARHMREYFNRPKVQRDSRHARRRAQLQALAELENGANNFRLERMVAHLTDFSSLGSPWARLLAWIAWKSARVMAGQFIAGTTPQEAQRAIQRMRRRQLAFTIDVLGEAAVSKQEAEAYQQTYLDLIDQLPRHASRWSAVPLVDEADGRAIPRVNVSVKLTAIHPGLDPIDPERSKAIGKERLRPILRRGMAAGAHIHVDMEHYAIKDLTLELFKEIMLEDEFRDYPHFGIVLQAYLKEGDDDARAMVEFAKQRGAPIWVRLVKGAYWDSETVWANQAGWPIPVWEQKWQSDACYERMTRILLENWEHTHGAFASHNIRSLAYAMALKRTWNIPSYAFELQMLYGMGDPMKRAGVELGERCRIYTPYGQLLPGMAYFIRRLLENTANESFLRQSADVPREILLRNPTDTGRATPPPEPRIVFKLELEEPIMDPFENVPNSDFGIADNRQALQAGLARIRTEMPGAVPIVIGGESTTSKQTYASVNPSRPAEIVAQVSLATTEDVERAVSAAKDGLAEWRAVAPYERAEILHAAADLLEQRRFDLAALAILEVGKPWREADAEVSEAIDYLHYYAREMVRLADNLRRRDIDGETNEYMYMPRGVAATLTTWSFPLALVANTTAAALVTGNAVIMKPARAASACAYRVFEALRDAGVPAGALQFLPGAGASIGEALVRHPDVHTIAFTGSRSVGLQINRLAANAITNRPGFKKTILELGGNNAIIVDSDADVDEALKGVVASAFVCAGQKCSAAGRVVVLDAIYDRFIERLTEAVRGISVGMADDAAATVTPVIDREAVQRLRAAIENGKQQAKCLVEVDTSAITQETDGGYFVGPVVFADAPADHPLVQEELFGPVLVIQRASDFSEAIQLFNNAQYALTGGIFSRSPANIARARTELECGTLYVNRKITGSAVDRQPFGGMKLSGTGNKTGGPDYLIQFCQGRTITENTLRRGFAPSEDVLETMGS